MTCINVQEKDLLEIMEECSHYSWASNIHSFAMRLLSFSVLRAKEIIYFADASLKYFEHEFATHNAIKNLPEKTQKLKLECLRRDLHLIKKCFNNVLRIANDMIRFCDTMNHNELASAVFNDKKLNDHQVYAEPITIEEFKTKNIIVMMNELKEWESAGYKLINRYKEMFFWSGKDVK